MRRLLPFLCVAGLGAALPAQEVPPELRRWLAILGTAEDRGFRALNGLIAAGQPAVDPLLALLQDAEEPAGRRWQAAKALGALRARKAVPALLEAVADPSWAVAAVSAEALGLIGDASVVPRLRELKAKAEEERVRTAIEVALARLEGRQPQLPRKAPAAADPFEARFEWAGTPAEGLARAREAGRPLLTFVYACERRDGPGGLSDRGEVPWHALLRGPLTDPDLTRLVSESFVTARVRLHVHDFSEDWPVPDPDPLAELGTSCRSLDPPALIVNAPGGEPVLTHDDIGVFDARSLHRVLRRALAAAGTPWQPQDGSPVKRARAAFLEGRDEDALALLGSREGGLLLRGRILHHAGRHAEAVAVLSGAVGTAADRAQRDHALYLTADAWSALGDEERSVKLLRELAGRAPPTVWSHKAAARLDPRGLDIGLFESHGFPDRGGAPADRRPEAVPEVAARAVGFLVEVQHPDGSWRTGLAPNPGFDTTAITAIVTGALHDWRAGLEGERRAGAEAAFERGRAFVLRASIEPGSRPPQIFNQTYALELVLDLLQSATRPERRAELAAAARRLVRALAAHQYPNGGWSYLDLEFGKKRFGGVRDHSFNTATVLSELVRARRLGVTVEGPMVRRGVRALRRMRADDGAFMYAEPEGFQWMTRPRASIGRDCCCELALLQCSDEADPAALADAVGRFHSHRKDLEIPRKLYSSFFNRNGHGSYFWAFAYLYAAKALAHVPAPGCRALAADLSGDLLSAVEADGTWIDSHATGKAYATGMVLRALKRLEAARLRAR